MVSVHDDEISLDGLFDQLLEGPAIRHITFWREGFSVEDGPLMRYDNEENSRILDEINSGCVPTFPLAPFLFTPLYRRAPPSILNVAPGQPVELRVARRLNEDYVPPPAAPAAPFSGSGNRLGSVVPDITGAGRSSGKLHCWFLSL
jgi:UBX domain-containing protein 1